MRRAIFPGTFDPFTIGHYSVVQRTLTFMDEVVIGIGINENKNTYFPIEKRVEMIRKFYKDEPRIKVESYDCLTIDFAHINRKLAGIETILLFTEPELTCVSSTIVRELLGYNKDISMFIPKGMEM